MINYGQSINKALDHKLSTDNKVILLGEDIVDPYGGAFKITKGLSQKHPGRVINTPMSEYALTGVVAGLAIRGMKPILEIMFGDFMTICADQIINHAAKFGWMYNSKVSVPMVIRTPMGGRRGYGPTHSQTIEKIFLGIPGLKIIAPSHYHDTGKLLIRAIDDPNPVIFIEHKLLYGRKLGVINNGYIFDHAVKISNDAYPVITISNCDFANPDISVLTYGGILPWVLDAVNEIQEEEELNIEIIVPSLINAFPQDSLSESLKKSGRMVIVEEGTLSFGWGAEMSANVCSKYFNLLKVPIVRVGAKDLPIGNTRSIEDAILPQVSDVKSAIRSVCS